MPAKTKKKVVAKKKRTSLFSPYFNGIYTVKEAVKRLRNGGIVLPSARPYWSGAVRLELPDGRRRIVFTAGCRQKSPLIKYVQARLHYRPNIRDGCDCRECKMLRKADADKPALLKVLSAIETEAARGTKPASAGRVSGKRRRPVAKAKANRRRSSR